MRRLIAFGLAVWLASAALMVVPLRPVLAQDGATLGDAPYLENGAVVAASGDDIVTAASVPAVDISSRSASANFYFSYYTVQPAINWTGSQTSCTAGTTSAAFKSAVIDRVAFYRAMAGVPSAIGLAATSSAANQQAALMFSRNNQISHTPPSSWACYTSAGAQAAGSSNIALGAYGVGAIDAYMKDAGGNNTAAGHRRWILFPQTQSFGTGDVPSVGSYASANSLWVWDSNVDGPRPATRDGFVAWPPQGYVPYQVVYPRWTFSYPGAGFGSASVTVTLNGSNVPVSIDSTSATGYGENTIVFRPNGLGDNSAWPNPGTDKTYTVRISGVSVSGASRTFTYSVTIFDPSTGAPQNTPTRTPTRTPTGAPGTGTTTPTATPGGYAPGDLFMATTSLSLRSAPSTSAARIAVLPTGTVGQVTGPPTRANGYTFYPVTVSGVGSGWAAGEYFSHVSSTTTPTATRTPTTVPTATRTPTQGSQQPTATRQPGGFVPGDIVRTTATVNFRSGPGTNYSVLSVVSSNTRATITGSPVVNGSLTWYPLTITGAGSGWMASSYLALVSGGNPQLTSTPTSTGGIGVGTTVYATANLNIRSGPGTSYSSLGIAAKGTAATVTGAPVNAGSVNWYPLDVAGIGSGWASGSYLSTSPTVHGPRLPASADPIATATAVPSVTELPIDTPKPTESQAPTETTVPTETQAPTEALTSSETPAMVDVTTATLTPEATATGEEPPVAESQPSTETPSPADEVAVDFAPDETSTVESALLWLPIERIQRSPDSQPGQVLVDDDPSTVWFANGAGQPLATFVLDLGQESAFSQITWLTADSGLSGILYLSVSSDGESWTDLDPTLAVATGDGWSALDAEVSGHYIRFVFVNDAGAEWLGGISEVRIMP